jgi:putative methyltransferase (TIGR04325 family)
MKLINNFLASKYYENISPFFAKKIFKIFKIFFVKTKYDSLPKNNYIIKKDETIKRFEDGKVFQDKNSKPYITYSHLLDLITVMDKKENFNFLDYGAGNLDLFFYLKKKIPNINYFFYDLQEVMDLLKIFITKENLKNIEIYNNINNNFYDLVYFGSSLQYVMDYKKEILKFKDHSKYILISQTPFFHKMNCNKESLIIKQVNMHPNINYLHMINFYKFLEFMNHNNFTLVDKNLNKVTKFLNFKNFKKDFVNIDMYDLLFINKK